MRDLPLIISVDDHVIEPPDMFDGFIPSKFADAAPQFISDAISDAHLSEDAVENVREALRDVGAVDAVESRIDELTESAMATLERAHLAEPAPAALTGLVVKATQRTY